MSLRYTINSQALIFATAMALDQGTKLLAVSLDLVRLNTGISFGLGQEVTSLVMIGLLLVVAGGLWIAGKAWWRSHPVVASWLFAGIISNLIDRVWWGGVRDWFFIPGLGLHNNLADWYITLSLLALMWLEGVRKKL